MLTKEQIAHDLTIIYMNNRYGIDIRGKFDMYNDRGDGNIETQHFPDASQPRYTKVGTGEKNILGLEKKQRVQCGNEVDSLFEEMATNYYAAYSNFYKLLCNQGSDAEQ